jgi:urease accessory protein
MTTTINPIRDKANDASPPPSEAAALSTCAARLRLLQLASQALPTGAFAYSSGLESLYGLGHLRDETRCQSYLNSLMDNVVVHLELPLFCKMRRALVHGDFLAATELSDYLLASRESMEMQEQERQMGRALRRTLVDLRPSACEGWQPGTFLEALAHASNIFGLSDEDAQELVVYTWLEQHISALCRIVPLGPLAGQRVLDGVLTHAPYAIMQARNLGDDEIGASAPQLALASALHETQYTRIFRS